METTTTEAAARLCAAAGLAAPGTRPGFVSTRDTTRRTMILDCVVADSLGAWQSGAILLVEEIRRRRERSRSGDRWPERRQRYLVIEEPREGGAVVHRHPVVRTVRTVRGGLAWALRIGETALGAIDRVQGDVYVLRREGAATRLRSDALPARHDVMEGRLVHPLHGAVSAAGAEEVYRVCRQASPARHATRGSRD